MPSWISNRLSTKEYYSRLEVWSTIQEQKLEAHVSFICQYFCDPKAYLNEILNGITRRECLAGLLLFCSKPLVCSNDLLRLFAPMFLFSLLQLFAPTASLFCSSCLLRCPDLLLQPISLLRPICCSEFCSDVLV